RLLAASLGLLDRLPRTFHRLLLLHFLFFHLDFYRATVRNRRGRSLGAGSLHRRRRDGEWREGRRCVEQISSRRGSVDWLWSACRRCTRARRSSGHREGTNHLASGHDWRHRCCSCSHCNRGCCIDLLLRLLLFVLLPFPLLILDNNAGGSLAPLLGWLGSLLLGLFPLDSFPLLLHRLPSSSIIASQRGDGLGLLL
ncbi:hypothetical protein PRIPAC_74534, partial [Pristionchus pacificus]